MEFLLQKRKNELEENLTQSNFQLLKINYLLEEKNMKYEVVMKDLLECIVYYMEEIIKDYSEITDFILKKCGRMQKTNPAIKCI